MKGFVYMAVNLSHEEVTEIQQLLDDGKSLRKLGVQFGVSASTIQKIRRRELYADVNPDWRYKRVIRQRKLTDEQVREVQELLDMGYPIREIAEMYNVSRQCIMFICQRKAYKYINPEWEYTPRRQQIDERMIQRMWRLWSKGYTQQEVSRLTGLSESTVLKYMKEMESKAS